MKEQKSNGKFQGNLNRRGRTLCYLIKLIKLTASGPSVFNEENTIWTNSFSGNDMVASMFDKAKLIISSALVKLTVIRPSHHFATGACGKRNNMKQTTNVLQCNGRIVLLVVQADFECIWAIYF